jgi:DNA-binding PadR family transcriptional regulator
MLAEAPLHGYAIRQAIVDHTGDSIEVEAGNLYRHIRRLHAETLIDVTARGARDSDDERRRYFRLTSLGRRVLAAELERTSHTRAILPNNVSSSARRAHDRDTERRARGEQLYRTLLRLYPADFRELYGEMMVDFYRARMGEDDRAIRLKLYADVVAHGIRERISPLPLRNPDFSSQAHPHRRWSDAVEPPAGFVVRAPQPSSRPAFTATILITLALGIGANVAIFSVVSGVLLRPLPFADAERVIQLSNGDSPSMLSEPEVVDLTRDARSFARIGTYSYADGNVTGGQEAERVRIARVSAGFFQTLSPTPYLGRVFTTEEDAAGAGDVVVISYGLWQRRFGMDAAAIGKQIVLNGTPRTVVGVMPAHLDYPTDAVAVWLPIRLDRETTFTRNRNNHYLRLIARLAPGVTLERADAEVRALRDRWTRDFPNNYKPSDPLQVDVRPIRDRVVGSAEPYLVALLGAVGFVLLIACVNVANLLLARGEVRRKEMMIRSALGAKRGRIAMQLSLESAILTFGGGLLGVAVAYPALRMIVAAAPGSIPRVGEIRLDVHALLFAAIVCVVTGVLFALVPIVRGANVGVLTALNSGSRNAAQSGGRGARRTRGFLVASEVALAVMMLAGAGLFLRTLMNLRRTDLGFASSEY